MMGKTARAGGGEDSESHVKIKLNRWVFLGVVLFCALICGCQMPRTYGTWFHKGISPISPKMGYSFVDRYQTVDTLTPEFRWRDLKQANQTYELAIWETPYRSIEDVKKKEQQFQSSWGLLVYSTNDLAANFHRVTVPLKPDTYYNWSVRIRSADTTNAWSTFAQQRAVLNVIYTYSDVPFAFKTPSH